MNAAETKAVCRFAFQVPIHATQIEALVGAKMLKAERKAGHVAKTPASPKARFGAAVVDRKEWQTRVLELVAALEGKLPLSSKQMGVLLGCARETAVKRAMAAIKQGKVRRFPGKGNSPKNPIFVYEIAKASVLTKLEE